MSCLFLLFKNPDLKNFEKYISGSEKKNPEMKKFIIYVKVSA